MKNLIISDSGIMCMPVTGIGLSWKKYIWQAGTVILMGNPICIYIDEVLIMSTDVPLFSQHSFRKTDLHKYVWMSVVWLHMLVCTLNQLLQEVWFGKKWNLRSFASPEISFYKQIHLAFVRDHSQDNNIFNKIYNSCQDSIAIEIHNI